MSLIQNEECFIRILQTSEHPLTTSEILEKANNIPEFDYICGGCSSGTHVIMAGKALIMKGKVNRQPGNGGFYWSLKEELQEVNESIIQ